MLPEAHAQLVANVGERCAPQQVRSGVRRSTVGAMTAPPSQPRSANYSSATIFAAGFGLIALLAVLGVLSAVVRDANADALEDKVVPGKISVVGAAKVRTWQSKGFEVQVPAGWGNIATGPVAYDKSGYDRLTPEQRAERDLWNDTRNLVIHRWQSTLAPSTGGDCLRGTLCAEIQVENPVETKSKANKSVKQFAVERLSDSRAADELKFIDLGPVTARGGRWVWRWSAELGGQRHTIYFFATCQSGRVAQYYQVVFRAPAGAEVKEQFADLLASITTELPSQPRSDSDRPRDCSDVVSPS